MTMTVPALQLRRLDSRAPDFDAALAALASFEVAQDPAIDAQVADIIADVRRRGDAAVLDYTARFDNVRAAHLDELAIDRAAMRAAYDAIPGEQREALAAAAQRIRAYHERQAGGGFSMTRAMRFPGTSSSASTRATARSQPMAGRR